MNKKKIIIYGAGIRGKRALDNAKNYADISVVGFCDSNKTGMVEGYPIIDIEKNIGEYRDAIFVIAVADFKEIRHIYFKLKSFALNEIYEFLNKTECFGGDFLENECIRCGENYRDEMPYAEMHLVDFCNLNCKGCTHFSSLFEKKLPHANARIQDVQEVKDLVANIRILGLMGGEPLLNPDIKKYLTEIRKILPDSVIQLVSNGLLFLTISQDIVNCIREQRIMVVISEYEPTHKIINKIVERLKENRIDYSIRPYDRKQKFCKPLSISTNSKYPKRCMSSGCINIWEGKIACCPTLMYVHKVNEKFQQNFPTYGIYEMHEMKERGEGLIEKLYEQVPLCGHCVENMIDWERCGSEPVLADFACED